MTVTWKLQFRLPHQDEEGKELLEYLKPLRYIYVFFLSMLKYINNSLHLVRKYARIFVRGHYLFRVATVFREHNSRKTESYKEQIMSKDKYPSIFSPQMEAIVFTFLQIFYARCAVLKIFAGEYSPMCRA